MRPPQSFREERKKKRRRKHRKNGGRRAKGSTRRSRSSRRLQPFGDFGETTSSETTPMMAYDIQADDGSTTSKVGRQYVGELLSLDDPLVALKLFC